MPMIEHRLWNIFTWDYIEKSWTEIARSVPILVFLLESVNAELGVTGEFVGLGVTEFGFSDGIISVAELLADSICRKLNYFSAEKNETIVFFLVDYKVLFN